VAEVDDYSLDEHAAHLHEFLDLALEREDGSELRAGMLANAMMMSPQRAATTISALAEITASVLQRAVGPANVAGINLADPTGAPTTEAVETATLVLNAEIAHDHALTKDLLIAALQRDDTGMYAFGIFTATVRTFITIHELPGGPAAWHELHGDCNRSTP
jgi:hypothetical protein